MSTPDLIIRNGRVIDGTGAARYAADVAISTTFGPNVLKGFRVWTDEVVDARPLR